MSNPYDDAFLKKKLPSTPKEPTSTLGIAFAKVNAVWDFVTRHIDYKTMSQKLHGTPTEEKREPGSPRKPVGPADPQ